MVTAQMAGKLQPGCWSDPAPQRVVVTAVEITCVWPLFLKGFIVGQGNLWLGDQQGIPVCQGRTLICKDPEPFIEVLALKA